MSIYKSTLNTSKPKKEKRERIAKTKVKQQKVIDKKKFVLIVILSLSAICLLFLCVPANFLKNFLLGMLGLSSYPLCLLVIFLCAMGLGKTKYEINRKYVIYLTGALFFVLMVVHLILTSKVDTNTFSQYLKDTYTLKTSGAGIIMSLVTYWLKKYLTVVGAYILAIIMFTVFVGLILDARQVNKANKLTTEVKKSEFDFSGMISGQTEEVPVTMQYKQEDIKKKIAKQKLGLEASNSSIISSSMRIDDVNEDNPTKYKSKREYILTPPEIVMPDYKEINITNNQVPKRERENEDDFKKQLNSDIFVTDTTDFYKDSKVIEGKEIDLSTNLADNKIQTHLDNDESYKTNNSNLFNADNKIQSINKENNQNSTNPQEKFANFNSQSHLQDNKDVFNSNNDNYNTSTNTQEEYDDDMDDALNEDYNEFKEDEYDDVIEDANQEHEFNVSNKTQINPQNNTNNNFNLTENNINHHSEDIQFANPNTSEVVHTNTFTTQEHTFTQPIKEEKKEENLLGRPKKHHPEYVKPPANLLEYIENTDIVTEEECNENIEKLERVLEDFKINAKVKAVQVGPAVTRYELSMPQGVSVKKVQFHIDDIAMALASNGSIRIEAPIPGKNAVGIEVPNRNVMGVSLREMIESVDFQKRLNPMSFVLGKDINGSIQFCNLDKMPHLLVAGSTGSGKSVCLNTMIISMLYKSSPEDVRLILIDPKTVEFSTYANLPHLLTPEIITTKEQTINALNWAIKEMEYRYGLLQRNQVVNIKEYNSLDIVKNGEVEKLPYIVIVIDELGDLMIEAKREMEERIMKLAQKSRAAGIHLVIATQRPSVDVITGTIKANLPSRIAFALTNFADSKTVIDMGGAEKLLGKGDMLFKPSDLPEPRRVQGAFVSSREVASVVKFIKENNRADFDEEVHKDIVQSPESITVNETGESVTFDPVLKDALRFFIQANQASITMIQRRFGVGYARAARIIDQMEQNGFIAPADGSKPRQVLISLDEYNLIFNK